MLTYLDYILPICGVVAILILIALIYVNRTILLTDYGLERQEGETKRLQAENEALKSIIADKNKTILNLLNKDKTT
jgi:hypothetical protein